MRKPEKLPSGRHKVRYRFDGRQSSQTFDSHGEALRFSRLLEAMGGNAQAALDHLFEESRLEAIPTLDELAAAHIKHLSGIEPGTRLKYERLWERTWSPLIGTIRSHLVTSDDIALAINVLAERYATKSLENQRGLLAGVLNRAVDKGHLVRNPAKGIRLPRTREHEQTEMRILTVEEFDSVLARVPDHAYPMLQFLWGTGARWGEAVALPIEDWRRPNVRIRRALKWSPDNQRRIGPTKTKKSNRTVTVGELLSDVLDDSRGGRGRSELLLTAQRGGMILHRTFWSRVWRPAVEHLELPRPRIHDLRHSHASLLLGAGVPINVVSRRLGHESIQTTVDTYGHLLPDAQLMAAKAIDVAMGATTPRQLGQR